MCILALFLATILVIMVIWSVLMKIIAFFDAKAYDKESFSRFADE